MPKTNPRKGKNFIEVFHFATDKSKPGRILSTVRMGDVYMSRLIISPGIITGNYYHKRTKLMFYVGNGTLKTIFENVKTKERKEMILKHAKQVIHVPPYVSFASKNIGKDDVVVVYFSNKPLRSEDNFTYQVM